MTPLRVNVVRLVNTRSGQLRLPESARHDARPIRGLICLRFCDLPELHMGFGKEMPGPRCFARRKRDLSIEVSGATIR
jgi:hypothetical protein